MEYVSMIEVLSAVKLAPVMLGLYALIESELNKRGWKMRDLALNSTLSEGTLSRIKNNPEYRPDLQTLAGIAIALDIPLRRVIEACGYSVESGAGNDDEQTRIMALLTAVPELQTFLEPLAGLRPDDRLAVLTYAEMLLRRRNEQA
jgi:transcriptional regulator with XRE-family HTH domain